MLEVPLAGKAESVPVLAQQGAGKGVWFVPGKVGKDPVFSGNSAGKRLVKVNRREGVVEVVFAGDSLRTRGKDGPAGCDGGKRKKGNH